MATISFHASAETDHMIRTLAAQQGLGLSAFVSQMVEEGLRMRRFPGILFRQGPTGRRAALAGSLDVWEVIAILTDCGDDDQVVLSAYPSLTPAALKIARAYYTAYPQEVEARITTSQRSEADAWADLPVLFTTSRLPRARSVGPARKKSTRGG